MRTLYTNVRTSRSKGERGDGNTGSASKDPPRRLLVPRCLPSNLLSETWLQRRTANSRKPQGRVRIAGKYVSSTGEQRSGFPFSTRLTPTSALGSPPVGRACRNTTAPCYSAPNSERSTPSGATPCLTAPLKSKSRIRGTHTNGGLSIRPSKAENAGTSSPEISVLGLCSSLTRPGASNTSNSRSPTPSSPPGPG